MKIKPWTTRELSAVARMVSEGVSHAEIAAELGRTLRAVESQACRSRIINREQRAWTYRDDAEIVDAIRSGQSVARIAVDVGRSENAIRQRLHRIGFLIGDLRVRKCQNA